jgi:hypothetical protein
MESMIQKLVDLINNFDPVSYLPEIDSVMGWVETFVRLCVMAAPVIMLVFGLSYLLLPPKEANHEAGYRFYFGMGSVEAWRFTQKLAGFAWSGLGLVLTVLMFLISGGFRGMDMMEMADTAVRCVLWELGLMALCCIVINITLTVRYDRKGQVRWNKK